jgi:transcriptional regulator with XRE-family HTH domain
MSVRFSDRQYEYTPERLEEQRKVMKLTQLDFSGFMGMPLRTYEDLIKGRASIRPTHGRASEMAMIYAVKNHRALANNLPDYLKEVVLEVAEAIKENGAASDEVSTAALLP